MVTVKILMLKVANQPHGFEDLGFREADLYLSVSCVIKTFSRGRI